MTKLKTLDLFRIAKANGVNTIGEYAKYVTANKKLTREFPAHMNRAILEGVNNVS